MTRKQIDNRLKNIEECKEQGFLIEAFIHSYHLNLDVIKFLLGKLTNNSGDVKSMKVKEILSLLILEVETNVNSKTIIRKKNLKVLKPWLVEVDDFFKEVKTQVPTNTKQALLHGEKIFALLNMSLAKVQLNKK